MLFLETHSLAPLSPTLPTSVGVAIVCAYILNFAKRIKQIKWVTYYTPKINTAVRAITSFASTIGISITWSSATHTLSIGNLTLAVIVSGLYHWIAQFGIQHGFESVFQYATLSTQAVQAPAPPPNQP